MEKRNRTKKSTKKGDKSHNSGNLSESENANENDTSSVLVLIIQCETKACDQNIANLKWIFSDHYFTVQVCSVDPPTSLPTTRGTRQSISPQQYIENHIMQKALIYASKGPYINNADGVITPQYWWNKLPCILIKDSSISNLTPTGNIYQPPRSSTQPSSQTTTHPKTVPFETHSENTDSSLSNSDPKDSHNSTSKGQDSNIHHEISDFKPEVNIIETSEKTDSQIGGMKNRIKTALADAPNADIYFLCKWQDMCHKHKDITESIDNGSQLKWSIHPTASQAIMYTPKSREHFIELLSSTTSPIIPYSSILNNEIQSGRVLATVFVPNIIDFDISLSTSNQDYLKLNECAPVQTSTYPTSASPLIWFIVLLILIILVAWTLIQMIP